jgi:hypothetical protein
MTTLTVLSKLEVVALMASHATWAYYSIPAYKRTKHPGFLLWSFAAIFGLWNCLTIHTIGADPRGNPHGFQFVRYSYRILFIFDSTISMIGTVMLIGSYLKMFDDLRKPLPPSE